MSAGKMLAGPSKRKRNGCGDGYNHQGRKRRNTSRPTGRGHTQTRPSDHWKRDALPSSEAEEIISSANWDYLFDQAEKHHSADVTCTADLSKWTRGVYNVVFELAFSDGTFWVARIRLRDDDDSDAELETEMLSELATMNIVRARTSIPIPAVFAYRFDKANPFGYPYMLTSALPGRLLENSFASSVPKPLQPRVAGQLARYIWELSQITFDQIGRVWCGRDLKERPGIISFPVLDEEIGPFNSASAYFFGIRREVNRRIQDQHVADEDWPQWLASCKLFTGSIPMLVLPRFRWGPFPLYHCDFHYNNILLDEDYNITGVLDWTNARTVPVEQFTVYPDLMTYPALSDAENQPFVDFRQHFVAAYRRLETADKGDQGTILSRVVESALPETIFRWGAGVPRSLARARISGLCLVRSLYGSESTLDNYDARRKKGFGRQFRSRLGKPAGRV